MSDLSILDADLNQKILTGKAMEGFEQYYADNVVMQENGDAPCEGKDANRQREHDFFATVAEFHGAKLEGSAINGDTTFGQWWIDATFKNGFRRTGSQIAVRKWNNGKIVHERFFYNKG